MKKIFIFLLLGLFMVSMVSAWSFDNVRDQMSTTFDGKSIVGNKLLEKYKPIKISNAFDLPFIGDTIFEGYLSQHTDTCENNCSSTIEINLHEKRPLVDDIDFYTIKEDGSRIEEEIISYQFYIGAGEGDVTVEDYELQCNQLVFSNGTKYDSCSDIKIGSHTEKEIIWIPYELGTSMPKGIYTIKLEGEKESSKTVDWVIKTGGETLNEWAIWGFSPDLISYYTLDESSGPVIDSTGTSNGVNHGATPGVPGIIDTAYNFSLTDLRDNITVSSFTNVSEFDSNFSINFWTELASLDHVDAQQFISIGKAGDPNPDYFIRIDGTDGLDVSFGTIHQNVIDFEIGVQYMVTLVHNSTNDTIYVNGSLVGVFPASTMDADIDVLYIGNHPVNNFSVDGIMDEIAFYKKALNSTEVSNLYDGGSGSPVIEGIVTLNSPADDSGSSINLNQFNATATITGGSTLVNMSLWTNETGDWTQHNITTGLSGTTSTQLWNRTFPDGLTIWNVQACDSDGACGFSNSNRTFVVDAISPIITVVAPNETIGFGEVGGNETLNVTFTDSSLDECWYDYNGTNITIEGCVSGISNSTNFTLEDNNFNMTIYSNDTSGNLNSTFISWSYILFKNSETFNSNTTEGSTETFSINITVGQTPLSANFIYNGTITSADIDTSNFPIVILSETITIPNVDTSTIFTFFWNLVSDSNNVNSTTSNQTVNNLALDNCSSFGNVLFNYTIVDEASQTQLNGTTQNVTLEVDISIFSFDRSLSILNFSTQFNQTNPNAICSSTDLFNETTYVLDSIAKYSSDTREIEYYNIRNATIDNSSSVQNITLFDILSSESTDFQITFKNSDFIVVEGALIQVNRQYVSEGIFKTVELPITDSNGQTVVHLVRNDIVYNYIVSKDGVIIGTFNNLVAFCEDQTIGQCFISLNALQGTTSTFNPDDDIGLSSSFTFNETTRDLVFTFSTNDGTVKTVLLNGTKMDQIGNTSICSSSVTSSSGTLTCNIAASIGNETIIATVFVNGQLKITKFFKADQDLDLGDGGYFLLLFLVVSMGLMFSESKSMMIVGIILGFIGGGLLFMIKGGPIAAGGAIMWLIVQGVILLWKFNSEGQT